MKKNSIIIIIVVYLSICTQMIAIYIYCKITLKSKDIGSIIFLIPFSKIFTSLQCIHCQCKIVSSNLRLQCLILPITFYYFLIMTVSALQSPNLQFYTFSLLFLYWLHFSVEICKMAITLQVQRIYKTHRLLYYYARFLIIFVFVSVHKIII